MTFAPVKSDPYRKGVRRKRRAFRLWSEAVWKRIEASAKGESDECWIEVIREANRWYYGIEPPLEGPH